MSLASSILPKKPENTPCPTCHSAFRWLDIYGTYRCKHCFSPPSKVLVRRIETLINWQVPGADPGWETTWEPPPADGGPKFYDVFAGEIPPGWYVPYGWRESQACLHESSRAVPCRGGEWLRIECVRCGRCMDLIDNFSVEF